MILWIRLKNILKMCKDKGKVHIDTLREDLDKSKKELEQNIKRGDDTLCDFIRNVLSRKMHLTPTDGIKH